MNKEKAKKELEKIYDNNFKFGKMAKSWQHNFSKALKHNPALSLILKLVIFANVGIWIILLITVNKF